MEPYPCCIQQLPDEREAGFDRRVVAAGRSGDDFVLELRDCEKIVCRGIANRS